MNTTAFYEYNNSPRVYGDDRHYTDGWHDSKGVQDVHKQLGVVRFLTPDEIHSCFGITARSFDVDLAVDYIGLTSAKKLVFIQERMRASKPSFWQYKDITIRYRRSTGARTELEKMEKFVDMYSSGQLTLINNPEGFILSRHPLFVLFYAYMAENGTVDRFVFVDLHTLISCLRYGLIVPVEEGNVHYVKDRGIFDPDSMKYYAPVMTNRTGESFLSVHMEESLPLQTDRMLHTEFITDSNQARWITPEEKLTFDSLART